MPANSNRRFAQSGFGLPETMAAALLFAVSLLGLLQYHEVLQRAFQHQWQQRQAWRLVSQQLEAYEAGIGYDTVSAALESGWRLDLTQQPQGAGCVRVTATASTPRRYQARLTRWFCRPAAAANHP
ncbi:prepilin-type N-terminal cleavage/methylation domain-containing protein [Brenneria populi subsp. brevivirga]|nr:prepilin-type N-terminal cleavage/methylation domain-containing protein [Brenneria populi subsp. brevivirga]